MVSSRSLIVTMTLKLVLRTNRGICSIFANNLRTVFLTDCSHFSLATWRHLPETVYFFLPQRREVAKKRNSCASADIIISEPYLLSALAAFTRKTVLLSSFRKNAKSHTNATLSQTLINDYRTLSS